MERTNMIPDLEPLYNFQSRPGALALKTVSYILSPTSKAIKEVEGHKHSTAIQIICLYCVFYQKIC